MSARVWSHNVTNAPEGALTLNLENVEVTVQNKLHYYRTFSGHKYENQQRAITLINNNPKV